MSKDKCPIYCDATDDCKNCDYGNRCHLEYGRCVEREGLSMNLAYRFSQGEGYEKKVRRAVVRKEKQEVSEATLKKAEWV